MKDITAGIIVAIIALPLSIALALASGVNPERGIYTAIIAGFLISFLGGSRVQIAGPTAAFATIVAGIVATQGMDGLIIATVLAGVLLIIAGLCKLGTLIKFIPYTITTGFTAGIAVTILIGQIKDFLGLTFTSSPIETTEKVAAVITNFSTINLQALFIGALSLAVLIIWPKINKVIPGSLIAILLSIGLTMLFDMKVNTIGSLYTISGGLPKFTFPNISFASVRLALPNAFTIAILAAIESLLSCVVSDGMIQSKHHSNAELVAQGVGNIASVLFGGIPATGAIARTAANVKNGGRTPIAGMVHAVVLLLILVVLMPYAALIPMPTIAAILFMVAYNMSEWRTFRYLLKTAPVSDILVLVATFLLTVIFDLVVAIEVGMLITLFLFLKRMSEVTKISGWKYTAAEQIDESQMLSLKEVPAKTRVFEITGPLFFGVADRLLTITTDEDVDIIILRMRSVSAIDASAMHALEQFYARCAKKHIRLILSHVNEQPMAAMKKAGFLDKLGNDNLAIHIDDALQKAYTYSNSSKQSD